MTWKLERPFLPSHRSASREGDLGQRTLARCRAHQALSQSMARGHQERHWYCRRWRFGAPVTTNPRRSLRRRRTEVALNGYRSIRRLATSLVITGGLWLLTGCNGLAGGSNGTGTVVLGSGSLNFGSVP